MLLLLIIGLAFGLFYWGKSVGEKGHDVQRSLEMRLAERNREWIAFIQAYHEHAESDEQRALLVRIMQDIAGQYGGTAADPNTSEVDVAVDDNESQQAPAAALLPAGKPVQTTARQEHRAQVDNATLLLYFGAFLFVASVGLFVAFGDLPGVARTLIVLMVLVVMYGGGLWLFKKRTHLRQAGLTFVGIGMAIAPLVGLAAYNYVFDQGSGFAVWFATSVLCAVLYEHALLTLRHPLLSYLFLGTFVSLFESAVGIVDAPLYFFGWGLIFVGIVYGALARWQRLWPMMQESSRLSAHVLLPVSLLVSLYAVSEDGLPQLGVSLLLAALFYGVEAYFAKGESRENQAVLSHWSTIAGIAMVAYGLSDSWETTAVVLLGVNVLQTTVAGVFIKQTSIWHNALFIACVSHIVGTGLALAKPELLALAIVANVLFGMAIWLRQKQSWGYPCMMLSWMVLPIVVGQMVLSPHWSALTLSLVLVWFLAVQLMVQLYYIGKSVGDGWKSVAQTTYMLSVLIVVLTSVFAPPVWCLLVTLVAVKSLFALMMYDKTKTLALFAGMIVIVPIARALNDPNIFALSVSAALALNIVLALWQRREATRWFSTMLWILLPVAIGNLSLGQHWSEIQFAWMYLATTAGLVMSRAIANGVLGVSGRVPLVSYARSASMSYVMGYWFAGSLAVLLAMLSPETELLSAAVVALVAALAFVLSRHVEKQPQLFVVLPFLAQIVLWLGVHPTLANQALLTWYLFGSTCLAVVAYGAVLSSEKTPELVQQRAKWLKIGSLITAFVAPASVVIVEDSLWPMAVGLIVAGGLALEYARKTTQGGRELAGGVSALGILWLLGVWSVGELQAYIHVIIILFALYAYWRHVRKEYAQSDHYIIATLITATVPLALQAISGASGGLYGWWLLLEQVCIMLLGMSIKKRFVTFWGLYVALGAVLYQLRHLGWAALTVLAVFLIGLAVYRIQKTAAKSSH